MLTLPIYMDNHSTTRVDPRVLESMLPYFSEQFGNAASVSHAFGTSASEAVEQAREQIGRLLNTPGRNLVFTSGATESNNLAIKGALYAAGGKGHLITNVAEHRSVLDPAKRLERQGYRVTWLPVDAYGRVDPQQVDDAIEPETVLVSVMAANNEVGTINDVVAISRICRQRGVLFHTDAAQAAGSMQLDLAELPIDLLSLTAHKLYGPKGVAALWIRRGGRARLEPLFDGGGHERRLRSGTLPVPLVVGFGRACELVGQLRDEETRRIAELRDRLYERLAERVPNLVLNGHPSFRLPGNLNISAGGVDGDALMASVRDVAVSSGSACTSADPEPSHVLRAIGRSDALTRASLRFGLGRFNTVEEVDYAAEYVADCIGKLRSIAGHNLPAAPPTESNA